MRKSFHNIEYRRFPGASYYVGYSADGRSWRIHGNPGNWSAYANLTSQGKLNTLIGFDSLAEISNELGEVK